MAPVYVVWVDYEEIAAFTNRDAARKAVAPDQMDGCDTPDRHITVFDGETGMETYIDCGSQHHFLNPDYDSKDHKNHPYFDGDRHWCIENAIGVPFLRGYPNHEHSCACGRKWPAGGDQWS